MTLLSIFFYWSGFFSLSNLKIEIRTHPHFYFHWKNENMDVSVFRFSNEKILIQTRCHKKFCPSGLIFINGKIKIRTCPDFYFLWETFKSLSVRIFIYHKKISNPDTSGFQFFNCKISISDVSGF